MFICLKEFCQSGSSSQTVRNIVEKSSGCELEAAPAQPSALPRAFHPSLDVSGPGVGFGGGQASGGAPPRSSRRGRSGSSRRWMLRVGNTCDPPGLGSGARISAMHLGRRPRRPAGSAPREGPVCARLAQTRTAAPSRGLRWRCLSLLFSPSPARGFHIENGPGAVGAGHDSAR